MSAVSAWSRTTDAQRGKSLHCTAENSLPPSYNEVIKDDIKSEEPPPSYLESLADTEESNDPVQV